MECITWFVPIVPGKLEAWKEFVQECQGPRREELARSRQRIGLVREVAGHMQTPQGDDVCCLFHEAENLSEAFSAIARSDDPFDVWFRGKLKEVHGISQEILESPLPTKIYLDYQQGTA